MLLDGSNAQQASPGRARAGALAKLASVGMERTKCGVATPLKEAASAATPNCPQDAHPRCLHAHGAMTPVELNAHAAQLFYRGAASEAEQAWRRALQLAPNYVEAYANLASALLSRTPTTPPARDEAWRALRVAVQLAPASSTFYARLGAMVVAGRPLQALPRPARRVVIRLAHTAARLRPADGSLWCNLGLALATHGERRLARRAYARAATLEPANAEAHMGLAGVQARGAALRTLRRACALVPADARVYHNLGNLLHGPPPGGNLNVRATAAAARCFARAAARRHGQTALLARSSPSTAHRSRSHRLPQGCP